MSILIPLSPGFLTDLNDKTQRSTRNIRVKMDVQGLGSLEDVTSYLDCNTGINITCQETDTTGQATPDRAIINFHLEYPWVLGSGTYSVTAGFFRNRLVTIETTVGIGNEWIIIFSGRTSQQGMSIVSTTTTSINGNIQVTTEEVYSGMRNYPDPTTLVDYKIASDLDPDNSIIHYFTRIMGFSDSDVIAGEVTQIKDFVRIKGDKTAFQEIKELSQAWLAIFTIRYDGKAIWSSKHDDNYVAPLPEYLFNSKNILRQLSGDASTSLITEATITYVDYEVLQLNTIIYQSVLNRNETTNQLQIDIEAGKYWPDPEKPIAVAQLPYHNPETGVPYPIAINIITPTIGNTGSTKDILSSNGLPIILSFNDDTLYIQFNDSGYINADPSDIGKTVSGQTSGNTGVLVHYDNDKYIWYVKTTDNWAITEIIIVSSGIGSGTGGPGIHITRENEGSSEIVLFNPTGSTITITKLNLRGQPVRVLGPQIVRSPLFGIDPKDASILNLAGGNYMTDLENASITTEWWLQARSANRRIIQFRTPWMPQAQISAVVTAIYSEYRINAEATINSYVHEMRGAPSNWETVITLIEYDTASRTNAWWKLETIESGNQLIDEMGNYDATLLNPSQSQIALGAFGNGLYINSTGTNSGAVMLSNAVLRTFGNQITITAWVKSRLEGTGNSQARAISRDYSDHFAILINQTQTGTQQWTIGQSGSNITINLTAQIVHNVILSIDYDTAKIHIWVDGESQGTVDWLGPDSDRPLVIGCNTEDTIQLGTNPFSGVIDELKVYRGIATDSEAESIYKGFSSISADNQIPSQGEINITDIEFDIDDRPPYSELNSVFPEYLIAHWNLDDLTIFDSARYKYHGAVFGDPTIVPGIAGSAMAFNGSTDYVDVDAGDYANQQATITMLVKFDSFGSDQTLWVEGGNVNGWEIAIIGSSLIFGVRGTSILKTISIPTSIMLTGVWYRLTATIDITYNRMAFFLNNEEKGTNNLTGITSFQGSQAATIAALFDDSPIQGIAPNPGGYANYFDGTIQHVAIYSRPLTLIEIIQLSGNPGADTIDQKPLPTPPRGRFAGYAFDSISEERIITDVFGNGYNAIAEAGVTLTEGRIGRAVRMNGIGQYVTILNSAARASLMSSGVFSISFWIKSETTSGDSTAKIITADASDYWALTVDQTQTGNQSSRWYYGPNTFITLTDFIPYDKLTHIVMTWNTVLGRARIYKNTSLISEQTTISFLSSTRPVIIGENTEETPQPGSDPFVGVVDQLGFWAEELTEDEITDLFINPSFDRTVISGDTVTTGRIISNATGIGGNPKSVFNLDDGTFYAGDGGFTFGTHTFIYWNPALEKLFVSGDAAFSGTVWAAQNKIKMDSTGFYAASYDLETSPILNDTRVRINDDTIVFERYADPGWNVDHFMKYITSTTPFKFVIFGDTNINGHLIPDVDDQFDIGRISPSNLRLRNIFMTGSLDRLQVNNNGDAIRAKQFANVSIAANSSLLIATFLSSTNTVYCSATHREASITARNDPKTSQDTVGLNRTVTGWNTAATIRTIQFLMEQAF